MVTFGPAEAYPAVLQQLIDSGARLRFEVTDEHRLAGSNANFQRLMGQTDHDMWGTFTLSLMRPGDSADDVDGDAKDKVARLRADPTLPAQPLAPYWIQAAHSYRVQVGGPYCEVKREAVPVRDSQVELVLVFCGQVVAFSPPVAERAEPRATQPRRARSTGGTDRLAKFRADLQEIFVKIYQEREHGITRLQGEVMPGQPTMVRVCADMQPRISMGTCQKRLEELRKADNRPKVTPAKFLKQLYEEWEEVQAEKDNLPKTR